MDVTARRHTRRRGRWLTLLCLPAATILVTLAVADLVVPARDGILGYSRVFAPYLALLLLPLGLIALWLRGRARWALGGIVLVGLVIASVRFLPVLHHDDPAVDPASSEVRLATWNIERDVPGAGPITDAILERAPGIVALQELTPAVAEAIEADPGLRTAFPHRVLLPATGWAGMGLLSSWPLEGAVETSRSPPLIEVSVGLPDGPSLEILAAHAPHPTLGILRTGPRYDPTDRDISFGRLRERITGSLDAGRPLVLLGDFNVTDRELGYSELTAGLTDSYRAAGSGWGHTWRPRSLAALPFGLLRIDLVLSGPGVTSIHSEPDCTPRGSDHCILDVVVVVER